MQRALRTLSPQTPRPGGLQLGKKPSSFAVLDTKSETENEETVKVAIRVRPLPSRGGGDDQCRGFQAAGNAIVELGDRRSIRGSVASEHIYDRVYGEDANTCEIYDSLVRGIVDSVRSGKNGTIFTYGQTSSGKTFTMQGTGDDSNVGIIQLAARDIFQSIADDSDNTSTSVRVSYVEIYNEELRDLLNNRQSSTSLTIRDDKKGNVVVEGLKEVAVRNLDQLMEVFRIGENNKSYGSTRMNERSSRSHAILKIGLEKKTIVQPAFEDKENSFSESTANVTVKTVSTLSLCDLAGSESVRHTGASGLQKKEGGMINMSLLTLSKVLTSLGQKQSGHVGYRDSKLTRILKNSLSGNSRMAVICCISPSSRYVDETRSTLQFASRAKLVKTHASTNEVLEDAGLIAKLRLESAKVKAENQQLQLQLRRAANAKSNTLSTKRELENLKRFVFSNQSPRQAPPQDVCGSSVSLLGLSTSMNANRPTKIGALDDNVTAKRCEKSEKNLLRVALKFKAKQVEMLQEKLCRTKSRPSLLARSKDISANRRKSLIVEAQNSHKYERHGHPSNKPRSSDSNERTNQVEVLQAQLQNANNLIATLEGQVDDLSSQKNDALDWIEELFSKADQKDAKIKQIASERDNAYMNRDKYEDENIKYKNDLQVAREELNKQQGRIETLQTELSKRTSEPESTIDALYHDLAKVRGDFDIVKTDLREAQSQNENLKEEVHRLKNEGGDCIAEKNIRTQSELEDRIRELELFTSEYADEKQSLVAQIEQYEDELSESDALLKAKSGQLDDALFSLEAEKKRATKEASSPTTIVDDSEMSLTRSRCSKLSEENLQLKAKAKKLEQSLNVFHQEREAACVIDGRSTANALQADNDRLRREVHQLEVDFDQCLCKLDELSNEARKGMEINRLLEEEVSKFDCEKKDLVSRLEAADDKARDLIRQVSRSKDEKSILMKSNNELKESNRELCQSVERVQHLLDELSSENANLKEKNDSFDSARACLEAQSLELQSSRDEALEEKDRLNRLNRQLEASVIKITNEKGFAVQETETLRNKLDRIAADFEADFESSRSKIEALLREVTFLEASKSAVEENADRILKRDNGRSFQLERLKAEYKTSQMRVAELTDEVNTLVARIDCLKSENVDLKQDVKALHETVNILSASSTDCSPPGEIKRREIFGRAQYLRRRS